jgi:K+-sensing histidine kinase KdpD
LTRQGAKVHTPATVMPRFRRLGRYGVAALWVAAAALARLGLDPVLADSLPFATFFLGVTIAAWHLGSGPALFATLLSFAAADFLFVPRATTWLQTPAHGVALYFAVGFESSVCASCRRASR